MLRLCGPRRGALLTAGSGQLLLTPEQEKFLLAFEQCSLPARQWTHEAHVQMAWLYLQDPDSGQALERIRSGIQRYNARVLKRPGQYHETVTVAFTRVISARLRSGEDWAAFAARNPDLLLKYSEVLSLFYSPDLLASPTARERFVEPDRCPLPAAAQ